jgi:DNA repair protein RadA/Sms
LKEIPAPSDMVFLGEVGLLGELGKVPFVEARVKEAARVGFPAAALPAGTGAAKSQTRRELKRLTDLSGIFGRTQ